jgi:hypothetical protein
VDAEMVPAMQEQGDNGMAPDRHRQGKGKVWEKGRVRNGDCRILGRRQWGCEEEQY